MIDLILINRRITLLSGLGLLLLAAIVGVGSWYAFSPEVSQDVWCQVRQAWAEHRFWLLVLISMSSFAAVVPLVASGLVVVALVKQDQKNRS